MTTLATCWSMTINNPDENDFVLVRQYNGEYIRVLIWTLEEGEDGTPHIQAYVKLMKQQRMSFIKKLFPRGHFKSITADEYNRNCRDYAQKDDDTTRGAHVITYNEAIPDVVQFLRKMIQESIDTELSREIMPDTVKDWMETYYDSKDILRYLDVVERKAVANRPSVAKFLVSPTYTRVKKLYLREITLNIVEEQYKKDATHSEESSQSDDGELQEEEDCAEEGFEEDGSADESVDDSSEQDSEQED